MSDRMAVWRQLSVGLGMASLLAALPLALHAQGLPGCCDHCQQPMAACHCVQTRPVVQTQYRQEQVTVYRDVAETQYREERYSETVPQTTYENVTVDEGRYQMVWVSKPVTRQVAKTSFTQQVKTRTIPVTVMKRVPEVSTRLVPYQTVTHMTETMPMVAVQPQFVSLAAPMVAQPLIESPCFHCADRGALSWGSPWGTPTTAYGWSDWSPAPYGIPQTAILPPTTILPAQVMLPPIERSAIAPNATSPQSAAGAAPATQSARRNTDWQTIPSRGRTDNERYGDFEVIPVRPSAPARSVAPPPPNAGGSQPTSQFLPAPSAAIVAQARAAFVR